MTDSFPLPLSEYDSHVLEFLLLSYIVNKFITKLTMMSFSDGLDSAVFLRLKTTFIFEANIVLPNHIVHPKLVSTFSQIQLRNILFLAEQPDRPYD